MTYSVTPVHGLPEITPGTDLAALLVAAVPGLADGDILVVTSKIVSKAEGRVLSGVPRDKAIEAESVRVVARRGDPDPDQMLQPARRRRVTRRS